MRGFAGVNFKTNSFSPSTRNSLKEQIKLFNDHGDAATEWFHKNRIYLHCSTHGQLYVFGFKSKGEKAGVAWGYVESCITAALQQHGLLAGCFPYKVHKNVIYFIENGEIFTNYQKGDRIKTKNGNGVIWSIDDINDICVELDEDKSVLFEFTIDEIEKIKDQ
jgi:hypothetical protein